MYSLTYVLPAFLLIHVALSLPAMAASSTRRIVRIDMPSAQEPPSRLGFASLVKRLYTFVTTSNTAGQAGACVDESAMAWYGAESTSTRQLASNRQVAMMILVLSLTLACICTFLSK